MHARSWPSVKPASPVSPRVGATCTNACGLAPAAGTILHCVSCLRAAGLLRVRSRKTSFVYKSGLRGSWNRGTRPFRVSLEPAPQARVLRQQRPSPSFVGLYGLEAPNENDRGFFDSSFLAPFSLLVVFDFAFLVATSILLLSKLPSRRHLLVRKLYAKVRSFE